MKKRKRILSVGDTLVNPNAPVDTDVDFISVKELLSPPYPRLTDYAYDEIYIPFILCRTDKPLPIMQELYRVAKAECLLEVTVPDGSSDTAWENPEYVRPYFANSFLFFSAPITDPKSDYTADWQARAVYMRVPDGILQQVPDTHHFEITMTKRNVCVEICAVMQAHKPARKRGDKEGVRMPKMLVQPFSARVGKDA